MTNNPLFSVLIASYNNGAYLREAVQSIIAQTYTHWEIIIVDDCSSDNSEDVYSTLAADSRIRIYRNDANQGCGYTKRRCVELAKGEICGFLDPDDTLRKDALEIMVNRHISQPDIVLIHSKLYYCDEDLNIKSEYRLGKQVQPDNPCFFNSEGEMTAFSSFKKTFYNKTEGIDPFLLRAVDQDLYLKLYDAGASGYVDEALYYYRIHKGGISTNANARKAYYWKWVVIMSAIRRRNLNFESDFFSYFVPRHEYDFIAGRYKKYSKIDKIVDKLKSVLGLK